MIAALVFTALTSVIVLFHLALVFGAPWGQMALGGKYPGELPLKIRVIVVLEIVLLVIMALIVLTHAGLTEILVISVNNYAIWGVVAINIMSVVLNTITPSKRERVLWAPITGLQLICSSVLAF